MTDKKDCEHCMSTQQMQQSCYCSKQQIKYETGFVPECFVRTKAISQAERNFLICPTYNLGMYDVCWTCPLECVKNPNKQKTSNINEIVELFGIMLGIDASKKQEVKTVFNKLNTSNFKDIYSSLEKSSGVIKEIMNGQLGAPDNAKKILEIETENLRRAFDDLIKKEQIPEDQVRLLKAEINSNTNIQKLKSLLEHMKTSYGKAQKKN